MRHEPRMWTAGLSAGACEPNPGWLVAGLSPDRMRDLATDTATYRETVVCCLDLVKGLDGGSLGAAGAATVARVERILSDPEASVKHLRLALFALGKLEECA